MTLRGIFCSFERQWLRSRSLAGTAIFLSLLMIMVGLRAWLGMYGMRYSCHDAFLLLDGAWRMVYRQRPHLDFNSMVGPAAYIPTLIGFSISSNKVAGFGYGQAIVGLCLGLWAYLSGSSLYQAPRTLYAWCVAAISVSPSQLGLGPFQLTPGMTYNRYGYGLLGILLLECLAVAPEFEFVNGVSTGVILGMLAFTKMTSLFGGLMLLFCLIPGRKRGLSRWIGIAAGTALTSLAFLVYLHFDLPSILSDLWMTAHAKRVLFTDLYILDSIAMELGVALFLIAAACRFLVNANDSSGARETAVGGLAVAAVSTFLIFTNFQQTGLPLLTLFLIVLSDTVIAKWQVDERVGSDAPFLIIGGSAMLGGITVLLALASLSAGIWERTHAARYAPRFEAAILREFVPVGWDTDYTYKVNDGLELLAQYRKPGESIMSLDFTNPFSYGLAIPPAPGGSTNLQYGGSFNDRYKVSPERLFGAADLVMLPLSYSDVSLSATVPRIYGPYLRAHFRAIGKTAQWQLYRRSEPLGNK